MGLAVLFDQVDVRKLPISIGGLLKRGRMVREIEKKSGHLKANKELRQEL